MAALVAGAVAVAVIVVSVGAWVLVRRELRNQVDEGLVRRASVNRIGFDVRSGPPGGPFTANPFGLDNAIQLINTSGDVVAPAGSSVKLPVTDRDLAVAAGTEDPFLYDVRVRGQHLRVITARIAPGRAVQMARDLSEVDGTLRGFAFVLMVLASLGIAGAAGAGLLVARSALSPVGKLTDAVEHVARTKELDTSIDVDRSDELGRLARSVEVMLVAIKESKEQQRRLVADASHELRTPLTSLRTNAEVLSRNPDMDPVERNKVLTDLRTELEELSALVGELVALATETRSGDDEEIVEVHLDEIAAGVVERAHRRTGRTINLDAAETVVLGRPLALERAITNIVDNATKWGPPDEPIDVVVRDRRVEVRDRGPGIADEDRAFVFDRFYRATSARSLPGSGLGLAIVKQVAESHGGRAWAEGAEGGGAKVGFEVGEPDLP